MRRLVGLVLALGLFAGVETSNVAHAQPMPAPAWCPVPSVAPIGGWFWFVGCAWAPTPHPWIYSVDTQLPTAAGMSSVWFTVGNYSPYVPMIHVPMPALTTVGSNTVYGGCSQSLGWVVDWFSYGQFTAAVGIPGGLPSPTPAYQFKVGMSGICP